MTTGCDRPAPECRVVAAARPTASAAVARAVPPSDGEASAARGSVGSPGSVTGEATGAGTRAWPADETPVVERGRAPGRVCGRPGPSDVGCAAGSSAPAGCDSTRGVRDGDVSAWWGTGAIGEPGPVPVAPNGDGAGAATAGDGTPASTVSPPGTAVGSATAGVEAPPEAAATGAAPPSPGETAGGAGADTTGAGTETGAGETAGGTGADTTGAGTETGAGASGSGAAAGPVVTATSEPLGARSGSSTSGSTYPWSASERRTPRWT